MRQTCELSTRTRCREGLAHEPDDLESTPLAFDAVRFELPLSTLHSPLSATAMNRIITAGTLALVTSALSAQQPGIVPDVNIIEEGNSSTSFPWNRSNNAIRIQYIYDSSAFTAQGITGPYTINSLHFRKNGNATGVAGSTGGVTITLGEAQVDHLTPDPGSMFDANYQGGVKPAAAFAGTINFEAITSPTLPNAFFVNVVLTTPIVYDPSLGNDLILDIQVPANMYSGTGASTTDYEFGAGTPCSRLFNTTDDQAAAWTSTNFEAGIVVGFNDPIPSATDTYGEGCYAERSTFYESFDSVSGFDLAGTVGTPNSILLTPNGSNGYTVTAGSNTFVTPLSLDLGLGDDALSAPLPLATAFSYPDGLGGQASTMMVQMSSNGWLDLEGTATASNANPSISLMLSGGARLMPGWQDLNPASTAAAGTTHFDVDPVANTVTFTWLQVVEFSQTTPYDLQCEINLNTGAVEYRYQDFGIATGEIFVGFAPGNGAAEPITTDISASLPFDSDGADVEGLTLSSSSPVVGTPVSYTLDAIPTGTLAYGLIFGVTQVNPGMDLGMIGAPGCSRYVDGDFFTSLVISPMTPTDTTTIAFPNDPILIGFTFYTQAASLTPGVNPLGVLTSNGVSSTFGNL